MGNFVNLHVVSMVVEVLGQASNTSHPHRFRASLNHVCPDAP